MISVSDKATKKSFTIKRDKNGLMYAILVFNVHTKNHNDPQEKNIESTKGFMVGQPDNTLCLFHLKRR